MLDIDKQYVFNEQGEADSSPCAEGNAVQIPIDQFQQIEQLLSKVSEIRSHEPSQEETKSNQSEAELEYVNGILVIKSKDTKISASIVDDMREERIRELGGW